MFVCTNISGIRSRMWDGDVLRATQPGGDFPEPGQAPRDPVRRAPRDSVPAGGEEQSDRIDARSDPGRSYGR